MSHENVRDSSAGRLLCAIGNASPPLWVLKAADVFLYEQGVAAIRVTAKETAQAFRSAASSAARAETRTGGPRVGTHPGASRGCPENRFVPRSEIANARLGRGIVLRRLALTLSDGDDVALGLARPAVSREGAMGT